MTRRTMFQAVRDVLRRHQTPVDRPRTRIVTPRWARASEIVHADTDLSEWVHKVARDDWDRVKKGRNKR